jgi:hypothetical protein
MSKFEFDWNDPRASLGRIKVNQKRLTGLKEVPTEVLRNLWLVRFEKKIVPAELMYNIRAEDIADVVQELSDRGFVTQEVVQSFSTNERSHYYRLRDKLNADR